MFTKVIGIGDAGCQIVERVAKRELPDVETIVLNTHVMTATDESLVDYHYLLVGSGMGTGGDPMRGKQYAENSKDDFYDMLAGADKVIITAGMGGGTGSGGAHVIAYVARELGIPTVAIVGMPTAFEGSYREQLAQLGVQSLEKFADEVIKIDNRHFLKPRQRTNIQAAPNWIFGGNLVPLFDYYDYMDIHMLDTILAHIEDGV